MLGHANVAMQQDKEAVLGQSTRLISSITLEQTVLFALIDWHG